MLKEFRITKDLKQIYGFKDEKHKGRTISLISSLITTVYNVFITGIFYTGFLSMYDIDLVGAGIINFIPFLANLFCIFSPIILEKIKKRKWILIAAKINFYFVYIIVANIMPLIVTDPNERTVWFTIIMFVAYAVYALFSPGFSTWFYFFYPDDQEKRAKYLSYNSIFSYAFSSIILVVSGLITKSISSSKYANDIILGMRYFGFLLVLLDVFFQSLAIEYPYEVRKEEIRIKDVMTLPFKYKKFLYCTILMYVWSFSSNINNGLWTYHILNHVGLEYLTITIGSSFYFPALVLFTPLWQKLLKKYSWLRTFAIAVLLWLPTEIIAFFLTPERKWMYLPNCALQNIITVGLNLAYGNVLFLNLPKENSTTHISFQTFFSNFFCFLGLLTGTLFCKFYGDKVLYLGNTSIVAVQFLSIFKLLIMLFIGIMLFINWRKMTPSSDLKELDKQKDERKKRPNS